MNPTPPTEEDKEFIRRVAQAQGWSIAYIANHLFHDLLMALVPAGFEDRALQLYHAADALRVAEGENP